MAQLHERALRRSWLVGLTGLLIASGASSAGLTRSEVVEAAGDLEHRYAAVASTGEFVALLRKTGFAP